MADDHLFGGDFEKVVPPVSSDNSDHLFGGELPVAETPAAKSLYQRWLDETITGGIAGGIAKAAGQTMTLPGDALAGKFNIPPEKPGWITENDIAQQDWADAEMRRRAGNAAGFIGTGGIPSVTREGLSSIPMLNSGVSPETAAIARTAIDKYGFPVRPGQMSENWMVRSLDSLLQKIPGSGYAKNAAQQQEAINSGLAKIIGVDADKLSPEVMVQAKDKLSNTYKKIYSPDVKAKIDDQFSSGILDTLDRAKDVVDSPEKMRVLDKAVSNILDKIKGDGTISGPAYQGLRQTKSQLKDLINGGGQVGQYAGEIRGHLDDLFRRTIPPDKAGLLQKTDQQYAIMKQLRPLVTEGGDVSPARLMQIARAGDAGKERMAFGRGGDLGELANIGQRFKTMPSSNTAENNALFRMLGLGGAGLTGAGALMHDPLTFAGPAAAALGTGATARLLGAYMKSPTRAQKLIADALERKGPRSSNKLVDTGIAPYLPAIQGPSSQ